MDFKPRKLYVWLIAIAVVLAIYLLYNQISRTPPIEIDTDAKFTDTVAESNTSEFDSKIGMVGDVGVGTVQKARYTHLNAKKQVDREFGFEKLLHAEGDEWEIEKPYINIFRSNLKCYLTADEGKVQVEDAAGRATPKDATLTGNVVIHILPERNSKIKESFIYLDDVIFISEKSQFSTAGPIKFTSQDALMLGKGMELVYNDEQDYLESLKIINLETLRIRQSSLGNASADPGQGSSKATLFSSTQTERQKAKEIPAADRQAIEKNKGESRSSEGRGEYYRCVFRKNVIIDCPEQLILADEVSINDILFSGSSNSKSEDKAASSTISAQVTEESVASPQSEPNELSEQFTDIVVTCDDGIIVVPMTSPRISPDITAEGTALRSFNDEKARPTFIAQRIDYSAVTENTVANGLSELTFYANDITGTEDEQTDVPVKVTARQKAEFLPALNQVVFEGDVLCTMLRDAADVQQKYALSAPKLTVDLSRDKQSRADIKHLTAIGEVVQLDTSRWTGEELLGFTKLKCLRFDYDTDQQMYLATGPGIIAADNSKIAEPEKKLGRFSLQRPCYAVVRNFDTLKYFSEENLIIADAKNEHMFIDHFPIIQGQYSQQATATANHVEALLYETDKGQTELSTLSAKGGITYEEKAKKRKWGKREDLQFIGSEMLYDGSKSMITAWGDESQPCFLNGALAPGIEYDLKKDRIKTRIIGPGMLQMGK